MKTLKNIGEKFSKIYKSFDDLSNSTVENRESMANSYELVWGETDSMDD